MAGISWGAGVEDATDAYRSVVMDNAALSAFCRREHADLVGMIGLYCGDGDLAEDLVQEALVRLCRRWSVLASEGDAGRWVRRVAFNLAKTNFRTRATRRRILDRYGPTMAATTVVGPTPTALAVRRAVSVLPDRQRQAVILRYFCDLSVADVAVSMNCAEGTVKSLTSQAVAGLRGAGLEFDDD